MKKATFSRRDFLAKTALAGTALAIGTSHPSSAQNSGDKMKKRKLGNLEVSEIGAGCMSISANYGPPADKAQGIKTIRTAFEKGVTLFDIQQQAVG